MLPVPKFCVVCAKPSSLRCSRCLGANYCSVDCQRKHWKTHKESCASAEKLKKFYEKNARLNSAEQVDKLIANTAVNADFGEPASQFNMGLAFMSGLVVEKDEKKAFELFKKSASTFENKDTMTQLGICYFKGIGVAVNMDESFKLFLKSSHLGDSSAQFYLGRS